MHGSLPKGAAPVFGLGFERRWDLVPRKSGSPLVLAGDVGGTKTVLGLFSIDSGRPRPRVEETFASSRAANLEEIIERFLRQHGADITAVCFGVAGPVINGQCKTTNLPWKISEKRIESRFGFSSVRLLNDLTATAFAIPLLRPKELHALNRRKPAGERVGLVAPGTGLGMALVIRTRRHRFCIPSEGGHTDFAPKDTWEHGLWQHLHRRFGHVSVERVVSGPGLVNIYSYLKETGAHAEPSWLSARLEHEDPAMVISQTALNDAASLATESLRRFVSVLGAICGNLALVGLTTGGIYLGGGICPQILPELKKGAFLNAFAEKGRFRDLLVKIPIKVILNPRAALLGAASHAMQALNAPQEDRA